MVDDDGYSQCLTAKLQVQDKSRMRKVLISDLYVKVKQEQVPVDQWMAWIQKHLTDEGPQAPAPNGPGRAAPAAEPAPAPAPAAPPAPSSAGYPARPEVPPTAAYGGYPSASGRGAARPAPGGKGKEGQALTPAGPGYRSLAQAWGTVMPPSGIGGYGGYRR